MEVGFRHLEEQLLRALDARRFTPWPSLDSRIRDERRSLSKGFDRLLALEELNIHLYDHQRHAVSRVLQDMRGRALLADEVGLGKTIEAGIVLKEYMVRGLVRKVLILVPATLTEQWRAELKEKLLIDAYVNRDVTGWEQANCIIASLDTAKRAEHAARIHSLSWDMVIVDEAHRLKNRQTAAWRFVDAIRKKYLLLLTATPIQNDLDELYNMMTLLKPGLLQTYSAFREHFMVDKRSPKHVELLREHVREVMIRSTRADTSVPFPNRLVQAVPVRQTEDERIFYDEVLAFARRVYGQGGYGNMLPLILLLRELCSSPYAARRTLLALSRSDNLSTQDRATATRLAARALVIADHSSKLRAALTIIRRHDDPLIVFTQFRATQDALCDALSARAVPVVRFHGGMNNDERSRAVDTFRRHGGVLVSTEAGGEGQNLQFCRTVMNYDLPWNPMRIEQRIGRVHRLGQTRDVIVINLYTEDTIETYVYELLNDKIRLFEQVIGDLDLILTTGAGGKRAPSLETTVGRLILTSTAEDQLTNEFASLGRRLERARNHQEEIERLNHRVLGAAVTSGHLSTSPDQVGEGGDRSNPSAGSGTRAEKIAPHQSKDVLASLLHPLCVDVDFARAVLCDELSAHPAATPLKRSLDAVQFANVRARPTGRRLVHQRHVLFWFKAAFRSDETRERLYAVLVDPVTEQVRPAPDLRSAVDIALDAAMTGADGGKTGTYVLKRLYRRACRHVGGAMIRLGREHQAEADTRLARDKERLKTYYDGLQTEALAPVARDLRRLEAARTRERLTRTTFSTSRDEQTTASASSLTEQLQRLEHRVQRTLEALADQQRRHIEELEQKYAVRAEVTALAAALLWIPRVEYSYKLLGHVRREIVFYYDPLRETLFDLNCEVCQAPMTTVYACADGDLVCADCYEPCSACDFPMCVLCDKRRCHLCDGALCHTCDARCPDGGAVRGIDLLVCPACRRQVCGQCVMLTEFLVV